MRCRAHDQEDCPERTCKNRFRQDDQPLPRPAINDPFNRMRREPAARPAPRDDRLPQPTMTMSQLVDLIREYASRYDEELQHDMGSDQSDGILATIKAELARWEPQV